MSISETERVPPPGLLPPHHPVEGLVEPAPVVDPGEPVEHRSALVLAALLHVLADLRVVRPEPRGELDQEVHRERVAHVGELPEVLLLHLEEPAGGPRHHVGGRLAAVEHGELADRLAARRSPRPDPPRPSRGARRARPASTRNMHSLRSPWLDQDLAGEELALLGGRDQLAPGGETDPFQHREVVERLRVHRHLGRTAPAHGRDGSPNRPPWGTKPTTRLVARARRARGGEGGAD